MAKLIDADKIVNGIALSGDSFDVEEIPNWVFLRNKPKEE